MIEVDLSYTWFVVSTIRNFAVVQGLKVDVFVVHRTTEAAPTQVDYSFLSFQACSFRECRSVCHIALSGLKKIVLSAEFGDVDDDYEAMYLLFTNFCV